ncbi:hypothetical protein [Streptomyces sp. 7N604]|uniref:hypothetical protein n=1 Tax=Streptomyces sp. 7N604 TaxID=3457415 RepID=UPI003FD37543
MKFRSFLVASLAAYATLVSAHAAVAFEEPAADAGAGKPSGDASGPTLSSRVAFKVKGGKPSSSGPIAPVDTNWSPPPCWYEPYWTAKDFKSVTEAQWSIAESNAKIAGLDAPDYSKTKDRYKNGKPYKDFNVSKQGKGRWWIGVVNPEMKDDPKSRSCNKPAFWVDNGRAPAEPQAIDTKMLAQLAYEQNKVPDTEVEMNPDGKQTVNLPSWIWLDKAKFEPVEVRAELPGTGMWAATKAEPVSLHLDPGTEDAKVFPASGDCPINDDGSIGTPYTKDKAKQDPPCGITYLRSTNNAPPHRLKATLTWKISWQGSGGTGGDLPDGTFGTTTDVTVQEVQAINR